MNKKSSSLKAGIDYPKNWGQFVDWFHDEQACRDYLYALRWPNGFICPNCLVHNVPYTLPKNKLKCVQCRKQTSVTAGTIFDKTRTPLKDWFAAIWYLTNQKNGVSALGMQRLLGLGSYQTAWAILHRLRYAMINPERDKLSGLVEVDETFVGDIVDINQQDKKKFVVLIAIELIEPKGFGRIRLRQVDRATKNNIEQFIKDVIEPNSQIHTDGSAAYGSVDSMGYSRKKTVHLGSNVPAHETMPGVHRVASLLKRWLLGTYQGAVQSKQLDYYLDEYTFRFNRRKSRSRGLLFYRLLEQSVTTKPLTYKGIKTR
ncbi:IS1595 family transposase [Marinomonas shanghaiensis]|uniref:IS1595 family transposase n=1 Tax=Marinomonas shanghaiensis TaxID=2202418 RepID=UPI003A94E0D0